MQQLVKSMLGGGNPLTVGVGIVIEVIRKNNSDYDPEIGNGPDSPPSSSDPIYLGTLLRTFAKHVPDFMELILSSRHTVTGKNSTRILERKRVKAAFGGEIEPLGFDRFKTCELMAELLHCSNMGLLNERGSEAYIHERDQERQRLKAEGRLSSMPGGQMGVDYAEDNGDFQNGSAANAIDASPEEIRRLEVANASEDDGFEDVGASGELKDEFDEKTSETKANDEGFTEIQQRPRLDLSDEFVDEPLSSPKLEAQAVEDPEDLSVLSPTPLNADPNSPTNVGLTDQIQATTLGDAAANVPEQEEQSTTLAPKVSRTESLDLPDTVHTDPNSPHDLSPHPEDQPAPLFSHAHHDSGVHAEVDESDRPDVDEILARVPSHDMPDAADHPQEGEESDNAHYAENGHLQSPQIELDLDGQPVVGDYLKLMFVEHRVVPTILVRTTLFRS